jgi:hypothetical protein
VYKYRDSHALCFKLMAKNLPSGFFAERIVQNVHIFFCSLNFAHSFLTDEEWVATSHHLKFSISNFSVG